MLYQRVNPGESRVNRQDLPGTGRLRPAEFAGPAKAAEAGERVF
jgi:hypothetical protein